MNRINFFTISFLLAGIFLFSCANNNNDDDNALPDASFTVEITKAEAIANEIGTLTDYAFQQEPLKSANDFPFGNCASIEFDLESTPKKITIDFGEINCLCQDNRYRRGKIIVQYVGSFSEEGSVRTISTDNFFINDNQVVLNRTTTNEGYNASDHLAYSVTETGTIVWKEGGSYNWTSDRKREWIEGEDTGELSDDVYLITGTASGSNTEGDSFIKEITNPLKYMINCANIVSGNVTITVNNIMNVLLNFGDGECNNTAFVTILGVTFPITLW